MNIYGGKYGPVIPLAEPGYCAVCKSSPDLTKTAMIDTLADIRGVLHDRPMPAAFSGRIYICEDCGTVIGRLVEYGKSEYDELLEKHNELVAENVKLENLLAAFGTMREAAQEVINAAA